MSKESGVLGLLGIAFLVLKLCKVIDWSWWWVTLPFWGGIVLLIVGLIIFFIYHFFKDIYREKRIKTTKRI